jgi:DNA-binding NarL/FixJ family response regulator
MAIRLLVGEDSYLIQEGLVNLLARAEELDILSVHADFDSLLAAAEAHEPDVVLTDIRMPPNGTDEGIRIAVHLGETRPAVGVIVLSQFVDPTYAVRLLEKGADRRGYILKERLGSREQLVSAIQEVAAGGCVIDQKVVEALVEERSRVADSPLAQLTGREREVLAEVAEGKSNASIASSLFLTKGAVEKHINSIFGKLGLPDDTQVNRRVTVTLLFLADELGLKEASPPDR